MANITLLPSAKVPLIYDGELTMTTEWYRFFWNIYGFTGTGVVPVNKGGTGLDTIGDHQIIIGNGNNVFEPALMRGFGINVTYDPGFVNLSIGDSGVTPGTYGSASQVGVFTVNQYGVLTAASNTSIAINANQITSGTLTVVRGGTGQSSYTDGQLLIGNSTGNTLTKTTLTAGAGISVTNGAGSITIANTGVLSVSGTAPVVSSGGATPAISMAAANTTTNGYLTSIDWNTFNNKAPATSGTSILYGNGSGGFSNVTIGTGVSFVGGTLSATGTGGTVTSVSGTSPISVATGTTTPVISISQATTSTNGYLSSTDWNTFNNKANAFTYTSNYIPYGQGTTTPLQGSGLQFDGTTFSTTGISTTNNLTFSSTAQRIIGDFSNGTVTNRVFFQTSGVNANTSIGVIPNGTGVAPNFVAYNNSNPTNASRIRITVNTTDAQVLSDISGTGTYLPLTMYTGGSERIRIDTSGNVGIGTNAAPNKFQIAYTVGDPSLSASSTAGLSLYSTSTLRTNFGSYAAAPYGSWIQNTIQDGVSTYPICLNPLGGGVSIGTSTAPSTNGLLVTGSTSSTAFIPSGSTVPTNGLYLPAANAIGLATNSTNRIYVTSAGAVGIGITAPRPLLHVNGKTAYGNAFFTNSDYVEGTAGSGIAINTGASTGATYTVIDAFRTGYAAASQLILNPSGGGVSIGTTTSASSNSLLVAGTGTFGTTVGVGNATPSSSGAGITFPATQSASTDANTLDDYEEGTWTPADASGAGLTFTSITAKYTKIGNLVTIYAVLTYPATADVSQAKISGLPFTPGIFAEFLLLTPGNINATGQAIGIASTTMSLYTQNGSVKTNVLMTGATVYISGTYAV